MTNEELAAEIQAGRAGYGELWQQIQAFARQQAARYIARNPGLCAGAGIELDDLLQSGFLALYDAVRGYAPSAGLSFLGYYALHLKRHFRAGCGIRTSKRDPLGFCVSLDAPPPGDEDAGPLSEAIPSQSAQAGFQEAEDRVFRRQLHDALEQSLSTLDTGGQAVLRRRYYQGETLEQIAVSDGVSRERVRRTEKDALRRLRRGRASRLLEPFHEQVVSHFAWRGTGLQAFLTGDASSVERAAERTEEVMDRLRERLEQDRAGLCAMLRLSVEEYARRYASFPSEDGGEGGKDVPGRLRGYHRNVQNSPSGLERPA